MGKGIVRRLGQFSAALCRGLIEAFDRCARSTRASARFPRLYAAASLKQQFHMTLYGIPPERFPRLYAAASLKRAGAHGRGVETVSFPRLYAAASLKLL